MNFKIVLFVIVTGQGFVFSQKKPCPINKVEDSLILQKDLLFLKNKSNVENILWISGTDEHIIIWKENHKILAIKNFTSKSCTRKNKRKRVRKKYKELYLQSLNNLEAFKNLPEFECDSTNYVHSIGRLTIGYAFDYLKKIKTNCANEDQRKIILPFRKLFYEMLY